MYLPHLYPAPKSYQEEDARRFSFGGEVTAAVSGLSHEMGERVVTLWHRFSCDGSRLHLTEGAGDFRFTVGNGDCALRDGDRYALAVTEGGICVTAGSESALMDGIKTLVQLIVPEELEEGREAFTVAACDIHDAPALGFRGIHLCVFPDSRLSNIEKAIHMAGFLKLSHVILEFWGTFRYECLPELYWPAKSFRKEELAPLVALARSYGMEVIPMFNHFGHASQSRSCYGRHVVLDQNPRLSRLFEPDGWTWCLSNPDTYRLLAEVRRELADFCGSGAYFHLGFDEAYSFATCDRCRKFAPHDLLTDYLNRLTADLAASGRRPIIWHDELIHREYPPEEGVINRGGHCDREAVRAGLDRRIVVANWQYGFTEGIEPGTKSFMELGFDTLVCPWSRPENVLAMANTAKALGAYGILLTTWTPITPFFQNATLCGDCAWGEGDKMPPHSWTETATLLRRLYNAEGDFDRAGWSRMEEMP